MLVKVWPYRIQNDSRSLRVPQISLNFQKKKKKKFCPELVSCVRPEKTGLLIQSIRLNTAPWFHHEVRLSHHHMHITHNVKQALPLFAVQCSKAWSVSSLFRTARSSHSSKGHTIHSVSSLLGRDSNNTCSLMHPTLNPCCVKEAHNSERRIKTWVTRIYFCYTNTILMGVSIL